MRIYKPKPDNILVGDDQRFVALNVRQVILGKLAKHDLWATEEPHRSPPSPQAIADL